MRPLSFYKSLATAKGRKESGFFLVEGHRSLELIARVQPDSIDELLCFDPSPFALLLPAITRRVLTESQFRSVVSTHAPQGIAGVIRMPQNIGDSILSTTLPERILLLEAVQDPGNVGTLIRTAAAFGYVLVLMDDACADPFSPKAVQSSAGSVMAVTIYRSNHFFSLANEVKARGWQLVATDVHGSELIDGSLSLKHGIMLGNEGNGLSHMAQTLADRSLTIPMTRGAESLNVAAAGAILMFAGRE